MNKPTGRSLRRQNKSLDPMGSTRKEKALIASYSRSYGLTEETVARLITEGKIR